MFQNSNGFEKPYTKKDIEKLRVIGKKIESLQKKAGFKEAVKEFKRITT